MLLRIMLLAAIIALAGGCETVQKNVIANQFEQSSKSYNKMIRWNELDKAEAVFPPPDRREEFKSKVKAANGVKVTDFRIKSLECSPETGEATVVLDIDYYREPSVTVKTVEDVQKWKYELEGVGVRRWRLMTMPPDFR
jgi:vacuolar-type H+-ATPase subunit D/Vma8